MAAPHETVRRDAGLHEPARSVPLSAQVAEQVTGLITSGEWPVGSRIPAENELVARLGVSRNTIREALRALVYVGLLAARPGDGTYVCSDSELQASLVRRAGRSDLAETLEVRAVLERHAAGLAAARRTDADVARLRELHERVRAAEVDGTVEERVRADGELHRAVVASAGNGLLTDLYDSLGTARAALLQAQSLADPDAADEHERHHRRLVDAVAAGDPRAAERAAAAIVSAAVSAAGLAAGTGTDGPRRRGTGAGRGGASARRSR